MLGHRLRRWPSICQWTSWWTRRCSRRQAGRLAGWLDGGAAAGGSAGWMVCCHYVGEACAAYSTSVSATDRLTTDTESIRIEHNRAHTADGQTAQVYSDWALSTNSGIEHWQSTDSGIEHNDYTHGLSHRDSHAWWRPVTCYKAQSACHKNDFIISHHQVLSYSVDLPFLDVIISTQN